MANPIKLQASAQKIILLGEGVYVVHFKPFRKAPNFKPGQFLHLTLEDFDPSDGFWPESRVFSIASQPHSDELVIAYSVKGGYTKKMERELKPGKEIWLKMPYGHFIIDEKAGPDNELFFIAGGTGLTAFVSYLKKEAQVQSPKKISLFYGVRKTGLLLFPEILEMCQKELANFTVNLFVEEETPPDKLLGKVLPEGGRISFDLIQSEVARAKSPLLFVAGPPEMVELCQRKALEWGLGQDQLVVDQWA